MWSLREIEESLLEILNQFALFFKLGLGWDDDLYMYFFGSWIREQEEYDENHSYEYPPTPTIHMENDGYGDVLTDEQCLSMILQPQSTTLENIKIGNHDDISAQLCDKEQSIYQQCSETPRYKNDKTKRPQSIEGNSLVSTKEAQQNSTVNNGVSINDKSEQSENSECQKFEGVEGKKTKKFELKEYGNKKVDGKKVDSKKEDGKKVNVMKVESKKEEGKKIDSNGPDRKNEDSLKDENNSYNHRRIDKGNKADGKEEDTKKTNHKKGKNRNTYRKTHRGSGFGAGLNKHRKHSEHGKDSHHTSNTNPGNNQYGHKNESDDKYSENKSQPGQEQDYNVFDLYNDSSDGSSNHDSFSDDSDDSSNSYYSSDQSDSSSDHGSSDEFAILLDSSSEEQSDLETGQYALDQIDPKTRKELLEIFYTLVREITAIMIKYCIKNGKTEHLHMFEKVLVFLKEWERYKASIESMAIRTGFDCSKQVAISHGCSRNGYVYGLPLIYLGIDGPLTSLEAFDCRNHSLGISYPLPTAFHLQLPYGRLFGRIINNLIKERKRIAMLRNMNRNNANLVVRALANTLGKDHNNLNLTIRTLANSIIMNQNNLNVRIKTGGQEAQNHVPPQEPSHNPNGFGINGNNSYNLNTCSGERRDSPGSSLYGHPSPDIEKKDDPIVEVGEKPTDEKICDCLIDWKHGTEYRLSSEYRGNNQRYQQNTGQSEEQYLEDGCIEEKNTDQSNEQQYSEEHDENANQTDEQQFDGSSNNGQEQYDEQSIDEVYDRSQEQPEEKVVTESSKKSQEQSEEHEFHENNEEDQIILDSPCPEEYFEESSEESSETTSHQSFDKSADEYYHPKRDGSFKQRTKGGIKERHLRSHVRRISDSSEESPEQFYDQRICEWDDELPGLSDDQSSYDLCEEIQKQIERQYLEEMYGETINTNYPLDLFPRDGPIHPQVQKYRDQLHTKYIRDETDRTIKERDIRKKLESLPPFQEMGEVSSARCKLVCDLIRISKDRERHIEFIENEVKRIEKEADYRLSLEQAEKNKMFKKNRQQECENFFRQPGGQHTDDIIIFDRSPEEPIVNLEEARQAANHITQKPAAKQSVPMKSPAVSVDIPKRKPKKESSDESRENLLENTTEKHLEDSRNEHANAAAPQNTPQMVDKFMRSRETFQATGSSLINFDDRLMKLVPNLNGRPSRRQRKEKAFAEIEKIQKRYPNFYVDSSASESLGSGYTTEEDDIIEERYVAFPFYHIQSSSDESSQLGYTTDEDDPKDGKNDGMAQ